MKDDPLQRARQALQTVDTRRAPLPALDQSKGNALLARARAAAEHRPETRPVAPPAMAERAPSVEKVRLLITCATIGAPFVGIAERRRDGLLLVGHALLPAGRAARVTAEKLSGEYSISFGEGWACPHCGSTRTTWTCACCEASLQCGGQADAAGRRYCACGRLEVRHLVEVDAVPVRGQSIAATTKSHAPPAQSRGLAVVPTISKGR